MIVKMKASVHITEASQGSKAERIWQNCAVLGFLSATRLNKTESATAVDHGDLRLRWKLYDIHTFLIASEMGPAPNSWGIIMRRIHNTPVEQC